jgi:hypothetical protein
MSKNVSYAKTVSLLNENLFKIFWLSYRQKWSYRLSGFSLFNILDQESPLNNYNHQTSLEKIIPKTIISSEIFSLDLCESLISFCDICISNALIPYQKENYNLLFIHFVIYYVIHSTIKILTKKKKERNKSYYYYVQGEEKKRYNTHVNYFCQDFGIVSCVFKADLPSHLLFVGARSLKE